jgi:hypothetical protein
VPFTVKKLGATSVGANSAMAGQNAAWNYVVTAHRPSNVTQAVTAAFTGSQDLNLIIAK